MRKSTMVALGCGAGAVACIALAVHFWKRKQTGETVACGVVGGCAAGVAAGAVGWNSEESENHLDTGFSAMLTVQHDLHRMDKSS